MKAGFKQTEVGLIPEDWEVQRLGDLFDISSSKRVFQSEWRSSGVPFYRARELAVLGEKGRVDNELFITKSMYEAYRNSYGVPQIGDLLVTGVGTLGKVYVVPDSHEFYFKDGNIIWFKIRGSINSAFLDQLFQTKVVTHQIEDSAGGTTVGTYTISGAKKTTIPYPPPPEQESIAEALGDADALIESLERLVAKKRDVKQGAMQELLTARRRLPGFTGKWEQVEFGSVATIRNEKAFASSMPAETPCVELEAIGSGTGRLITLPQASGSSSKYRFMKGDVLFGRLRAYLKKYWSASFCGVCSTEIWPLIPRSERLRSEYLHLIVQTSGFANAAGVSYGTHMPRSDWSILRKYGIQLPQVEEQSAIASVLSDMDAEIAALEENLEKARAIKQGMMQELLTGRIRLV